MTARKKMRPPQEVMRLERMGCFHPMRLSFSRVLIRRMQREAWRVDIPRLELDDDGYGLALIRATTPDGVYTLVAFSRHIDDKERSDRVIAEAWDASFSLYDGTPDDEAIAHMAKALPQQEAARHLPEQLTLSRANKSVRLFGHVVDCLADGRQPDAAMINEVGYVMRTTAVYGNGKFGIADRSRIASRMAAPFQVEMLTVYLIRCFSLALVEHIAARRGGSKAVRLDRKLARHLGIGNSTGLGMAPFLVNHPPLLNNWMAAREEAIAVVRGKKTIDKAARESLKALAGRAAVYIREWRVGDERQMKRIETLEAEWRGVVAWLGDDGNLRQDYPLDALCEMAQGLSDETQEMIHSVIMEPFGDDIDHLAGAMSAEEPTCFIHKHKTGDIIKRIESAYGWALEIDPDARGESDHFWYVSATKLEPRLGQRHSEKGAEKEMPFDIPRRIRNALDDLKTVPADMGLARFVMQFPQHRFICSRVAMMGDYPYGEIRNNLVGGTTRPIDMLRSKLSFFGAAKFDPKSDLWTRISLFQGAPLDDELGDGNADADDWLLAALNVNG